MTDRAQELRDEAAERERRSAESFERSDTDGFLSQWANDITARKLRKQAEIEENGGEHRFLGLFDSDGNRIKAKLVQVTDYSGYGKKDVWLCLDEYEVGIAWINRTSAEVGENPSSRSKMGQLGLHEEWEQAPAVAYIYAPGTGLSGAASAMVAVRRTDDGYPPEHVVLQAD